MLNLNGFSARIRVDGVDIPEFCVEEDRNKRTITCWVPSQVGKAFEIHIQNELSRGPWGAVTTLDGTLTQKSPLTAGNKAAIKYFRESATTTRPFLFLPVTLVDDENLLNTSISSRLGEIEVTCLLVEVLRAYKNSEFVNKRILADHSRLHERAKKCISHHIGLGATVTRKECNFREAKPKEHIATFVFRYRSLEHLQAQGIAPLARQPSENNVLANRPSASVSNPTEASKADDSNDDDELRALQARLDKAKARMDEAKARKRKKKQEGRSVSKKVKKEENSRFVSGEIIDLT